MLGSTAAAFALYIATGPLLDERAWTSNVWQAKEFFKKSAAVLPAPLLINHCCQPSRKAK